MTEIVYKVMPCNKTFIFNKMEFTESERGQPKLRKLCLCPTEGTRWWSDCLRV